MRRTVFMAVFIAACFAASFTAKTLLERRRADASRAVTGNASLPEKSGSYERIVSLAPSITENLYALGLMDRVVGVTRYCDYPPEARLKTEIGGYYDPNYEAIVALNPDLIIMLAEHEDPREYLSRLGFQTLVVEHRNISGIFDSIEKIGDACGVPERGRSITGELRERMQRIAQKTSGLPPPRVLVSVGRNMASGRLDDVYISGKEGFYDQMIEVLGGSNAYEGGVAFPVISNEGIIQMNPDVIIDMVPDLEEQGLSPGAIRKEWSAVSHVNAVKNGRVYVFGEDFVAVPGPRFVSIMEKMARVMYPDVDWGDPSSPDRPVDQP